MKRNRIITALLVVCISLLVAFGLTACGNKCDHTYDNVCDTTCNICGEKRTGGGHDWKSADCINPAICKICSTIDGAALGHSYAEYAYDDHYHQLKCVRCGNLDEESRQRHTLNDEYNCMCGAKYTISQKNSPDGRTIVYLCNSNYLVVKETYYYQGKMEYCFDSYYNENRYKVKQERYDGDNIWVLTELYEYDKSGNLTKKTYADSEVSSQIDYEYDEKNNKIKETYSDSEGYSYITDYEYDENNRKTQETSLNGDGYLEIYTYKYDENGKKIKETFSDSQGYSYTIDYEYNENGKKIKEVFLDSQEDSHTYIYEYNAEGNIIRVTYIDKNGNETTTEW